LSLNSSHSRSTDDGSSKKPPLWPGVTVVVVPAFVTRLAVPERLALRLASPAQARGCACS
jgi:hypothetical protein